MKSQPKDGKKLPQATISVAPSRGATRLLWYEVEELPGPALRVRRVARPADATFLRLCLVGWFGFAFLVAPTFLPWPMVLLMLAAGCFVFYCAFPSLGLGAEEWRGERGLLVVRRRLFGWPRERRFTGAAFQITESWGRGTHAFFLSVHQSKRVANLLSLNGPTAAQTEQMHDLGKRLVRVTGWRLVAVSR